MIQGKTIVIPASKVLNNFIRTLLYSSYAVWLLKTKTDLYVIYFIFIYCPTYLNWLVSEGISLCLKK